MGMGTCMKILVAFLILTTYSFAGIKEDLNEIAIPRPAKTSNSIKVSKYIESQFDLKITRQRFNSGTNIIATQPGKSKETIILGAHYDSVRSTPGADDNASGCAMVLDLAKKLRGKRLNYTIKYIFFDNEENGLIGSRYYANIMKNKCIFMVNFDMVGRLRVKTSVPPDTVFIGLFKKHPWAKQICFRQGAGPSDHTYFQRKGIPFVWIFTGTHRDYHRPSDTVDKINYKGMEKISNFVEELVLKIDGKRGIDYNFFYSLPILKEKH